MARKAGSRRMERLKRKPWCRLSERGGFGQGTKPLLASQAMGMERDTRPSMDGLVAVKRARLQQRWREEIELAVDAIKFKANRRRDRDQMDRWIRHLWYKAGAIRAKRCEGPTVTRD